MVAVGMLCSEQFHTIDHRQGYYRLQAPMAQIAILILRRSAWRQLLFEHQLYCREKPLESKLDPDIRNVIVPQEGLEALYIPHRF